MLLFTAELLYFRVADHFNIIDKPNERSSHTNIVLRGGGIIFTISMIVWTVMMVVQGKAVSPYLPFLGGLLLIAGVIFVDDIHSLPDSVRLVAEYYDEFLRLDGSSQSEAAKPSAKGWCLGIGLLSF